MAAASPSASLPEACSLRDEKPQQRPATYADSFDNTECHYPLGRHPESVRRSSTIDDSDSGESTASASSKGSRRKRTKHVKSKSTRALKSRNAPSFESSLSSSNESFFPTLGRILEGKSNSKDIGSKPNTSSLRAPNRAKPYPKNAHNRNARVARNSHNSQAELQNRVRTLASPSLQSVISTLTAATSSSSGSNGSNSTVTQSSFSRSEAARRGASSSDRKLQTSQSSHRRRRRHHKDRKPDGQPDVFAFMEDEPTHDIQEGPWRSSSGSDGEAPLPRPQTPAMKAHRSSADPFVSPRPMRVASWQSQDQLHSDSGISVRGSSPESIGRRSSLKREAVQSNDEDTKSKTDQAAASAQSHIEATTSWQRRWSTTSTGAPHPGPYLLRPSSMCHPSTLVPYTSSSQGYSAQYSHPQIDGTAPSGYKLLASKLSDTTAGDPDTVTPVYRRFSRLNHRILLHLQDEIAEMEEQLGQLDLCIARYKPSPDSPESRRIDARFHGDLTFQRTELLGRIFLKTRQYNDALSSLEDLTRKTQSARIQDVERYRQLTKKLKPVVEEELRFLDHADDLLSFSTADQDVPLPQATTRPITALPAILLGPPATMLVAFVMFSAAAGSLARIFLFLLFSGAGWAATRLGGLGQDLMTEHERHDKVPRAVGLTSMHEIVSVVGAKNDVK